MFFIEVLGPCEPLSPFPTLLFHCLISVMGGCPFCFVWKLLAGCFASHGTRPTGLLTCNYSLYAALTGSDLWIEESVTDKLEHF